MLKTQPWRLSLWLQIFFLELRKILSYRVDFWLNFLGSIFVDLAIAYYLWSAIYTYMQASTIGGYGFSAMILYYLLVPLFVQISVSHEMHFVADEIYSGSLNRYLLYPLSFFSYKLIAHLSYSFVAALRMGAGLGLFIAIFGVPEQVHITWQSVLWAVATSFMAAVLYYLMAATLELFSFWADNVWSLMVILKFCGRLFGGGILPLALFPEWAKELLLVLPFSAYVALPIETALGLVSFEQWLGRAGLLILWCGVFCCLYVCVWQCGKYRYTGVGI